MQNDTPPRLTPYIIAARVEQATLGAEEIDEVVSTILSALEATSRDSGTVSVMHKCQWIDVLGKLAGRSDRAVAHLVEALDDGDGYDVGSSPYDSYWQTVHDRALSALYPLDARGRALPFVLRLLGRATTEHGRRGAARVCEWIGPPAAEAVPLLRALADDPSLYVRAAATAALSRIAPRP